MDTDDRERRAEDLPKGTADEQPDRERTSMDREPPAPEDPLVRREEDAAAAEAGGVGGQAPDTEGEEADRPVEEGGGGVAEGFETAERELTEQASHGEQRWDPEADEFPPEAERDVSTRTEPGADVQEMTPEGPADRDAPAHGEPDEVDPTEVTRDPKEGPDDPGRGPGIAPER